MPVRLLKQSYGQTANTLLWSTLAQECEALSLGTADTQIELASDYAGIGARVVTAATATVAQTALVYRMQSGSAQTLNLPVSGAWKITDVLTIVPEGAGTTTIAPASGVTINGAGSNITTSAQWKIVQLINIGPNAWVAVGNA